MTLAGGMFEPDSSFRDLDVDNLLVMVDDALGSVVLRGRAMLEIGRRAEGHPDLQEMLFTWMHSDELAENRWIGPVTLAWIAACCLGYSLKGECERVRLAQSLRAWPKRERELLLGWARKEDWFEGIDELGVDLR